VEDCSGSFISDAEKNGSWKEKKKKTFMKDLLADERCHKYAVIPTFLGSML
jgi:hypothetical protein